MLPEYAYKAIERVCQYYNERFEECYICGIKDCKMQPSLRADEQGNIVHRPCVFFKDQITCSGIRGARVTNCKRDAIEIKENLIPGKTVEIENSEW